MPMRSSQSLRARRLRLRSIDDVSLTSILHGVQIGPSDGANLVADNNELMARNNGAAAELFLQNEGGVLRARAGTSEVSVLTPYRQWFLRPGVNVPITNVLADVGGMTTGAFNTEVANAQCRVSLNARFVKTSGGVPATQIVAAYIYVDGVLKNSAHMTLTNPLYDDVRSCDWVGKLAAVGSHEVKVRCVRTGTTETIVVSSSDGTGLTVEVWG